jgi:hypothetical protein
VIPACDTRVMAKRPARPRDPNQLAKLILDMTTGDVANDSPKAPESPAIQARRIGGKKGGRSRAKKLSARKRKTIAKMGARARWRRA